MTKASILIIDDERGVRELLSKVLKKEGYGVLTAANGEEAIRIVKNKKINLTLVDLKMPGIDGIETIRRIKKTDSSTINVIITAYGEMKSLKQATNLGVFDYITKPFDLKYVKALIKHLLVDIKIEAMPFNKDLEDVFTGKITQRNAIKRKLALLKKEVTTKAEDFRQTGKNLDRQMASLYSSFHEFALYRLKDVVTNIYFIALALAILIGATFGYIYTILAEKRSQPRLPSKEEVTLKDFYHKLDKIEHWLKKDVEGEMKLRRQREELLKE